MFCLEEILSLIMKTPLTFSTFKEKPTKTKQSHMHGLFFFVFPKATAELTSVLLPALVSWRGLPQRGCIWNLVNFTVLFCIRQLKSFFLWIFAERPGSDGLVRIHTHWDQVLQSCKVGYILLSPHLHHLYMHFLNSFHFHKFLLTNIWVQPYGRKEYHKHDFFLK